MHDISHSCIFCMYILQLIELYFAMMSARCENNFFLPSHTLDIIEAHGIAAAKHVADNLKVRLVVFIIKQTLEANTHNYIIITG